MVLSNPASSRRSNKLLQYCVYSEFPLNVVAGSCFWSPTRITLFGQCWKGIRVLGSVLWHASSIIKYSNLSLNASSLLLPAIDNVQQMMLASEMIAFSASFHSTLPWWTLFPALNSFNSALCSYSCFSMAWSCCCLVKFLSPQLSTVFKYELLRVLQYPANFALLTYGNSLLSSQSS